MKRIASALALRRWIASAGLCLLSLGAQAASIGALQDGGQGQASLLQAGNEDFSRLSGYDRYAEWLYDGTLDLAALAGGELASTVYALGDSLRLRYLGTAAPQEARLLFEGQALVETRGPGCGYADWLADDLCAIDTVSDFLDIGGLTAGAALSFTLQGDVLPGLRAATALSSARWVELATGQLLFGFEQEGGDGDHADWVFLLDGASLSPTANGVPAPGVLGLSLAALLAGLALSRRQRRR